MMRIHRLTITLFAIMILTSCSSGDAGGYLGYPGFIVNPVLYANTEVDGRTVDLDIRKIYAVLYSDDAGNLLDNSLYVFFVPKSIDLNDIVSGSFKPYVLLRINDINQVSPPSTYSIQSDLVSSNFMTYMDINDGGAAFTGDSIELDIWQISTANGGNVEGEFTSVLSRNSHTGLAKDFKFDTPVNVIIANPPSM